MYQNEKILFVTKRYAFLSAAANHDQKRIHDLGMIDTSPQIKCNQVPSNALGQHMYSS